MSWLKQTMYSSIGLKFIMALTGLFLVFFIVGHLAGNLLVFVGADALNAYAQTLQNLGALLWLMRGLTLAAVVLHIFSAIHLTKLNRAAKPVAYKKVNYVSTTIAARSMILSGLLVLCFIFYHLAHLTFKWTHVDSFAHLESNDVYGMMLVSFSSPFVSCFYIISIIVLMLHLRHGVSSLFQSLGINHVKYNKVLASSGTILSAVVGVGFVSIPLCIWTGFIH